jgi:flagellar motor switch protein FliG
MVGGRSELTMSAITTEAALTGAQKAAVLMLALGEERCARLFELMHQDEIREVSLAMTRLGSIPAETVERLCDEFSDHLGNAGSVRGSLDTTERLLMSTLPKERAQQIMDEIRGPAGRTMWDKLGNVNETLLANYLKNEYPQTVAVVLGKIKPEHSARVMALLPESLAVDVIFRMLQMESVQREVLDGVENTLRTEFMSNLVRSTHRASHELLAEIFNNFERHVEARLIAAVEQVDGEAAEKIKSLMFTFLDLARLSQPSIQAILRVAERDKLPIALKGAPPNVLNVFVNAMSDRAAKMLRDDIAALGPTRLRDVDEAQASIVLAAKELAEAGEIDISPSASEQMVV